MNSIDRKEIVKLANNLLFENSAQINLPVDDGMYKTNTRHGMFDTPGPQITGDNQVLDQDMDLPLAVSDIVNNQSLIQVNFDVNDKSYVPSNKTELSAAISSTFSNMGANDLNNKEIAAVWNTFNKIRDKVKNK